MKIVLIIIIILGILGFISGFASDFVNAIFVFLIGVVLIISSLIIKEEIITFFEKTRYGIGMVIFGLFFGIIGFVRGSPLIWTWKETNSYLILGTLVEESDFRAGLGISFGYGLLYGIPALCCFGAAMDKVSAMGQVPYILFIIPAIIVAGLTAISIIIALVKMFK